MLYLTRGAACCGTAMPSLTSGSPQIVKEVIIMNPLNPVVIKIMGGLIAGAMVLIGGIIDIFKRK